MKRSTIYILTLLATAFLWACGGKHTSENAAQENTVAVDEAAPAQLSLSEVSSPEFPDSNLEMISPTESGRYDAGVVSFEYEVTNYQLGAQTLDADIKQCANSGQGQHIHLILNNQPYTAHYEPGFEMDLAEGHYVALSFLSRSYHESLKQYGAYVLRQFTVGNTQQEDVDLTAQHMFYSRPKGEYKGADTERILLDFYLVNTDLSPDGNKVKATINGQVFTIDNWTPYFVEGMPMGENTIKLELIDASGNLVPGPFNSVERTITLVSDSV